MNHMSLTRNLQFTMRVIAFRDFYLKLVMILFMKVNDAGCRASSLGMGPISLHYLVFVDVPGH